MALTPVDPAPALYTVERAARRLSLGRSKVYQLLARGDLPSVRIDGARRIKASDIDQFVERLGEPDAA